MQVLPKHRAREYESIFILHPDSQANVVDTVAARCQDVISRLGGKLVRAENWGRRRLAYPVKKNEKGIYIYLRYLGYQDLVHELERNFRAMDPVIKFLTVKIDEDVDPEARPVGEADISFVPLVEEEEIEETSVAETAETDTAEAAPEQADEASSETEEASEEDAAQDADTATSDTPADSADDAEEDKE